MNQLAVSSLQLVVLVPTLSNPPCLIGRLRRKRYQNLCAQKTCLGSLTNVSFFWKDVLWFQRFLFSSKSWEAKVSSFEDFVFAQLKHFLLLIYMETLRKIPTKRCQTYSGRAQRKVCHVLGGNKTKSASIWHVCSPEICPNDM